jgi:hypothetical protein
MLYVTLFPRLLSMAMIGYAEPIIDFVEWMQGLAD